MATNESDFAKLLLDAPMARDADIVTVAGILERTHDTARFMLRMSDGRSVVLDVDAVKSAKTIVGAVGQSLVQLELDAKRVPEGLLSNYKYRDDVPITGPPATSITARGCSTKLAVIQPSRPASIRRRG
jgi:hypothetical protein